ncbi:MAG TPA: sulfurtransferase TusA family protein [Candidatus Avidesulfovibrio excrementigallinarum]|nr:sulfurtransferase TusA family protein [Candidatus Avidesulfovibrio excrementigallinarum]
MQTIDTRGLSCPQPVLMVHPHLGGGEALDVLVDSEASQENVSRAAAKRGWTVTPCQCEGYVRLELRKGSAC